MTFELFILYRNGAINSYYNSLTGHGWDTANMSEAEALCEMRREDPDTFDQIDELYHKGIVIEYWVEEEA